MLAQLLRWSSLSTVLTVTSFASAVNAQGLDYSELGIKALISWRCAVLGNISESEPDEIGRLFDLGYPLMANVVEALQDGRVPEEQRSTLPFIIYTNLVGGPNTDFELGVIWSAVATKVSKELSDGLPKFTIAEYRRWPGMRKRAAEEEFAKSSCKFID